MLCLECYFPTARPTVGGMGCVGVCAETTVMIIHFFVEQEECFWITVLHVCLFSVRLASL